MISLINDTINTSDIDDLVTWLKTYPRLTKGAMTKQFEESFAKWLGCEYAVFVNSGSSANLIMVYALITAKLLKNNEIVVPSLCWITDIAPIIQFGLTPVLCDCNLENLSVDLNHLERIFRTEKPAALLLVSLLGFSPDMDRVGQLCDEYDVILLEDNCESLGTSFKGKKLGNFGLMSTTSMYFGHHISTIEGGMVFTNDRNLYNVLLSLRSHGWNRDWDKEDKVQIEQKYDISGVNSLYTFFYAGFNVRATDLQAFIGLNQLKKLDNIVNARNRSYKWYLEYLECAWSPIEMADSFTSSFAYPIISNKKYAIVESLTANNVEVRPLVCGSMGTQPFYKDRYGETHLKNCDVVDTNGIYVPNHPGLTEDDVKFVCSVINSVVEKEW
jgi:CDP-4-dehydro-6-deoxyglucose reductase, E1